MAGHHYPRVKSLAVIRPSKPRDHHENHSPNQSYKMKKTADKLPPFC